MTTPEHEAEALSPTQTLQELEEFHVKLTILYGKYQKDSDRLVYRQARLMRLITGAFYVELGLSAVVLLSFLAYFLPSTPLEGAKTMIYDSTLALLLVSGFLCVSRVRRQFVTRDLDSAIADCVKVRQKLTEVASQRARGKGLRYD
jgi:hypothetical protein